MSSQALQRVGAGTLSAPSSFQEIHSIGEIFAKSGFFSDAKDAGQAIVKIIAGQELGFGPMASMTGVYIVKGKVSLSANLMAAAIKRSGKYNFKVRELTPEVCRIEFFEGAESIGESKFTMAEAKAGKLDQDWKDGQWKDKATWKNFPRNMLYARAMSNGAKWFCPDIFGGPIYTPEELGATVNEEGELIEAEPLKPTNLRAVPTSQPAIEAEPITTVPLIDQQTFDAIITLWPDHGPRVTGTETVIPLNQYLRDRKGVTSINDLPADSAKLLLEWLQSKALKSEPAPAPSGLDQWACGRTVAMQVIEATKRFEASLPADKFATAESRENAWRAEFAASFEGITSRKYLTLEQARQWVEFLNDWAAANEAKAAA